jgi:NFU1 iron-sulfur cluster scaffold homolog, mitochondrial
MNESKIPVTVYSEVTPNPAVMKFVADKMLIATGEVAEYLTIDSTKGSSTIAEALFQFPFVEGIFIARNFLAITKNETISWDLIHSEVRSFITEFLQTNEVVVQSIPQMSAREIESEIKGEKIEVSIEPEINTELDQMIVTLLEEYVRPAVESDGGAIHFKSFNEKNGQVTVVLKGACSGCPSSTATLKGGIETLLKSHLPEVNEVVALEG